MIAMHSFRLPTGRDFTVHDLAAIPYDGNRYELVDGILVVSPPPGYLHQATLTSLMSLMHDPCPTSMELLPGPFAVRPNESTELWPDLIVARTEDLASECLPTAPLLAIEITTPSSEIYDRYVKKAAYRKMGAKHYWVIDPGTPSVSVFELADDGYRQLADVTGVEVFEAAQPFPVRIVPAELCDHPAVLT
jgi:Uma2 family endonuclease